MRLNHAGLLGVAALLGLGAAVAFPAQAEPISAAFDGHYQGSGELLTYLSQGDCKKVPDQYTVRIAKGDIRGGAKNGDRISGFVTKNGFFTGTYRFADGTKSTIQGRVGEGAVVGSVIKRETCAYMLTMNKM
jgi:hypothetical protein